MHFFIRYAFFPFYYFFLKANNVDNASFVDIPDKYYNASLVVLSYALEYLNKGEWKFEKEC